MQLLFRIVLFDLIGRIPFRTLGLPKGSGYTLNSGFILCNFDCLRRMPFVGYRNLRNDGKCDSPVTT